MPVSPRAAEVLFRLVDAAYGKRSLAITSNLHPSGFYELIPWTLAAAVSALTDAGRVPEPL